MKIEDFCDIRIGFAFRKRLVHSPNGNAMVIQPKNITSESSISFGDEPPLRTDKSIARPLLQKEVLVVNRGRFAAAVFDLPNTETWIVPSSIIVLSVNDQSVLPEYVVSYLNSANGQRLFQRHCEHTTVPFISMGNFKSMDIPIPPLDRQHLLVALDKATARYTLLSKRKQELLRGMLNRELRMEN